jgi:hypothetical protein
MVVSMSFEGMFDDQPTVQVLRSQQPNLTTDGGLANPDDPDIVANIRLSLSSSSQRAFWATLGIEADYELWTTYSQIQNGDLFQTVFPGLGLRVFRVTGTRAQTPTAGTGIAPLFKYQAKETTR